MATCMLSSKMSPIIRFVLKELYYSSRTIYNGVTEISRRGYSTDGDALPQPAAEDRNAAAAYSGLLEHYTSLVRDGALREDPHQKAVVQTWDQMHKTLRGYRNQPTSIFSKVQGKQWLWTCSTDVETAKKKRVNFHGFMLDVNNNSLPKRNAGRMAKAYDPIAPLAEEIGEEACLLCFDEFQNLTGASDYLEISMHFNTVFIRNIPLLTMKQKTQARRFIPLIDAFYDHKVRVVILSAHPLDHIFVQEGNHEHHHHELMDDLDLKRDATSELSIFSGAEEIPCLSEMQTEEYWLDGDRSTTIT